MEPEPQFERQRRDEFREMSVGLIVAMIVITTYGLVAPTRIELINGHDSLGVPPMDWAPLLLFLGSFCGAAIGWVLLAEQRWPWPFGPRRPRPPGTRWGLLFAGPVGFLVPQFLASSWDRASGLYSIDGGGEVWLDVTASVDSAVTFVLFSLFWTIAFAVGTVIDTIVRRRQLMTTITPSALRPSE